MKKFPIWILAFLVSSISFAQNSDIDLKQLVNNWEVKKMGDIEVPSSTPILLLIQPDNVVLLKTGYRTEKATYRVDNAQNSFSIITDDGNEETWTIKKLNQDHLVFDDPSSGIVQLTKTNLTDVPELAELSEPPFNPEDLNEEPFEMPEVNFKPSKKDKKNLVGKWQMKKVMDIELPGERKIFVEFSKKGVATLTVPDDEQEPIVSQWSISEDGKRLVIKDDIATESWIFMSIDKKELIVLDSSGTQITFAKTK